MINKIRLLTFVVLLTFKQCSGVIYHLNNTEYHRMPPLSALDFYDECLHQPGGLYCLARFNLVADTQNEVMTLIQTYDNDEQSLSDWECRQGAYWRKEYSALRKKHFNHSYVERGVCVTKSCQRYITNQNLNNSEDLNQIVEACVNASIWSAYGIQAKLATVFNCDRLDEETEIDSIDWIVAGLISLLLIVNLIGTLYDAFFYEHNVDADLDIAKTIILAFSVRRNWELLTSSEPKLKKFSGVHCLKVLATFLMMIPHVMFVNATTFTDNTQDFEKAYETTIYQVVINGTSIMQLFFVLSGFLMVYNLQIKTQKQEVTWATFPKTMFLRWWRLSASYAVVLAFTATWLRHLGSGPLWKFSVTNSVVADCRGNWWLHLLYFNNYVNTESTCAVHTWHAAADTQLFAIGLIAHILTRNRGRNVVLCSLMLLGIIAPALHVWSQDLDGTMTVEPEFYRTLQSNNFRWLYSPGHIHLPCFIIGMFMGYIFYSFQGFKYYHNLLSNKVSGLIVFCVILSAFRIFLTGSMFYEDGERLSLSVRMAYASTHRLVIGIIAASVIAALALKLNETYCSFFEWSGWSVLNKLSYGVFLLHMTLINVILGTKHHLGHVSLLTMITTYSAVITMSYVMALPLYLLVEAPIGSLSKIMVNTDTDIEKRLVKKIA